MVVVSDVVNLGSLVYWKMCALKVPAGFFKCASFCLWNVAQGADSFMAMFSDHSGRALACLIFQNALDRTGPLLGLCDQLVHFEHESPPLDTDILAS